MDRPAWVVERAMMRVALGSMSLFLGGCYASHGFVSGEGWADRIVETVCEVRAACPNDDARGVELCVVGLEEYRRDLQPWIEAIDRGDATVDPAALEACLDSVRDATCLLAGGTATGERVGFPSAPPFQSGQAGLLGFSAACDAVFVRSTPGSPRDASCDGPLDCAEGLLCRSAEDGASTCQPPDEIGSSCRTWCFGPDRACVEDRCEPIERQRTAADGEPCGVLSNGGRLIDERCVEDATCISTWVLGSTSQRCVALREEGQSCRHFDQPCLGGLVCAHVLAGTGTCSRVEIRTELGAACAGRPDGEVTAICDPRAGLTCSSSDEVAGSCMSTP